MIERVKIKENNEMAVLQVAARASGEDLQRRIESILAVFWATN
jgi:hypothetical protein